MLLKKTQNGDNYKLQVSSFIRFEIFFVAIAPVEESQANNLKLTGRLVFFRQNSTTTSIIAQIIFVFIQQGRMKDK